MPAIGRRAGRRDLPVLKVLAAMSMALPIALAVACQGSDGDVSAVTGQIVTVVPVSVTGLAELEIIDADGTSWRFEARGFVGLTPSHLEEHAALGQPVRVEYFEEDGRLVISMITDG